MPLSDTAVRNTKPGPKPTRLFDGAGLFLLVHPNGGKWWRFKYRFGGREKLLSLGVYPSIGLKQAREARDRARELLRQGTDPSEARKLNQGQEARPDAFEAIAREWHGKRAVLWDAGHAARVLRSLERDVFPDLGAVPIREIDSRRLLAAIRKIEARGAPETAGRALQRCGAVFRYAIATALADRNPAADLRGALTPGKTTHRPALPAADLPEFLAALDTYPGHRQTALALRLLLLTFVRPGELRGARWEEFDLEAGEWLIPANRMKMRDPHTVPLSRQALAVLIELHAINGAHDLVFPGHNPEQPMGANTLLNALYRLGYRGRATAHGFRATASTILNGMGHPADVIERQLAHQERNKVRAAYNRAQYLPERRALMQVWADYLDGIKSGGNIVLFRSKV